MVGSFISDTLTLNGAGAAVASDKFMTKVANTAVANTKDSTAATVNGKFQNRQQTVNENYEDEKTENDQDALDYDEDFDETLLKNDYLKKLTKLEQKETVDNLREQRRELLKALNNDLTTLEQLREQKKLLRSIRLRKEELKALEGRRKALEALKKLASDPDEEHGVENISNFMSHEDKEEEQDEEQEEEEVKADRMNIVEEAAFRRNDEQKLKEFENFLNMLKEKQVFADKRGGGLGQT
jgi:hypothetical protein